jgi:hypothetical protein
MFVRQLTVLVLFSFAVYGQVSFSYNGQIALRPPQSNTPSDQKCSLEGQVTNAVTGELVRKATINFQFLSGKPSQGILEGYTATSASDGSFKVDSIEPGDYQVIGTRQGYLRTELGQKSTLDTGIILSLKPADKKTGVTLTLIPQGTISGKVVDEDGDPVEQVQVSAVRSLWMNGKFQPVPLNMNQTNDLGEFRLK